MLFRSVSQSRYAGLPYVYGTSKVLDMLGYGSFLSSINTAKAAITSDDAGLPYVYGACKLLDLLGYGSMIATSNTGKAAITKKYLGLDNLSDGNNPLVYSVSQSVNMLPILAYQKIYFDFFSNSQWEKHSAYAYNVDYWQGTGSVSLSIDMLKMRYANYPKDYFMGILPSSQYGSVAVLPSVNSTDVIVNNTSSATRYATLNSDPDLS